LRQGQILSRAQLTQLERDMRGVQDPQALAHHLAQRGWLTPYQINQLVAGRGAELVIGPHLLLERLGEGGTGQVFKARHQKMGRIVAVKLIRRELLSDAEVVARFYREIRVVSQLSHPNVVHAYDAGPQGADHVLIMEFVEGTDLARLVKDKGPLPAAQACDCIRQAALGLQHAHERGLVHRDIKPPNLLLTRQGVVKVLDLGLARLQRPGRQDARPGDDVTANLLTPVNSVMMGTPDYMAPEQAVDFHAADIRADIYSLGCTLHFLLTGQPPFPGGSILQKLMRHQQAELPSVRQKHPELPAELDAVLQKMLAKRPEQRYQTPNEVAHVLSPFVGAGGARPASSALGAARRRRDWKRTAGVALLLVGLLVSAGLLWQGLGGRPTPSHTLAASRQSTALDEAGPPRPWFKNHLNMEFVLIPSGQFLKGSPATEIGRLVHEGEPREVRINKSFYMGRYEVTQGHYLRLIGNNPSFFHPGNKGGLNCPVENVTWEEAQAFCERLSAEDVERRAGRAYRLPTEAEWEYACRAGTKTAFPFGDDVEKLGDYAWYKGNSNGITHSMGEKKANRWGVHDMHGNVAEWVSDLYREDPWRGIPVPASPGPNKRATIRGGAWDLDPACSRSASRSSGEFGKRYNNVGFRVVCEIPERAP
jgi:formylglycine-generating enzyme required for sulfatase activity/tRNA A-37 threonylcarbamoyl transferase component Bud32